MMDALRTCTVQCPYCGEQLDWLVDVSAGTQRYVEDCSVCCRPIECRLALAGDDYWLEVSRDDQ